MPKIISINFMKNEAHCVERMLKCVLPFVSESYTLIDDTTTDNTKEICDDYGCNTQYYTLQNFGKTWNMLLKMVSGKSDFIFAIAPDETISSEFGFALNSLAIGMQSSNIDGIWFPRRHWADLDMLRVDPKDAGWWPDYQLRLLRNDYPRIHLVNYVHEVCVGMRRTIRSNFTINHFNTYWKNIMDYDFEAMKLLYENLKFKQSIENGINIWPDKEI